MRAVVVDVGARDADQAQLVDGPLALRRRAEASSFDRCLLDQVVRDARVGQRGFSSASLAMS